MKIFFIDRNSSSQAPKAIIREKRAEAVKREKRVPIPTKLIKTRLLRIFRIKALRRLRP